MPDTHHRLLYNPRTGDLFHGFFNEDGELVRLVDMNGTVLMDINDSNTPPILHWFTESDKYKNIPKSEDGVLRLDTSYRRPKHSPLTDSTIEDFIE